jgi:hypothetical protein
MPSSPFNKIELRAAEDAGNGMFYFLGCNPMVVRHVSEQSLKNDRQYAPMYSQRNSDGSETLQFFRNNFTDMTARTVKRGNEMRRDNFMEFVGESVLPRLMRLTGCDVEWNGEIAAVQLPKGELSLFTPNLMPVFDRRHEAVLL